MEGLRQQGHEQGGGVGFDEVIAKYGPNDEFVYKLKNGQPIVMTRDQALEVCGPQMRGAAQTPEGLAGVTTMLEKMHQGALRIKAGDQNAFQALREAGERFLIERQSQD